MIVPLSDKKKVFLATPHYGTVEYGAMRGAFYGAGCAGQIELFVAESSCSLLTKCFNSKWCQCQNDGCWEYFAMLHADVLPSDGWLDQLVHEMDEGGYDVIHAPVAIKDARNLTSTGLSPAPDNPWGWVRRVAVAELPRLPMTFNAEDCLRSLSWRGQWPDQLAMLPNTGCLVIRLKGKEPLWRRFPGFTVLDRIVRITPEGCVSADLDGPGEVHEQVVSEDWQLGLWCYQMGLRVACCQKVTTHHVGKYYYATKDSTVYGQELDENWFNEVKEEQHRG